MEASIVSKIVVWVINIYVNWSTRPRKCEWQSKRKGGGSQANKANFKEFDPIFVDSESNVKSLPFAIDPVPYIVENGTQYTSIYTHHDIEGYFFEATMK